MYTHTHTRIRKYVMVGADLPPPGTNRVKKLLEVVVPSDIYRLQTL